MKLIERNKAVQLRRKGLSINEIKNILNVSKSSVSLWVRDVELSEKQQKTLRKLNHSKEVVEKRRISRLASELNKREEVINKAEKSIEKISKKELWLMGVMLYWAEGGKTQRMIRFSNGDPEMIKIMMAFFRNICEIPELKFRGYIHIHPHLDYKKAERYWSNISGIPLKQFFKTYRKRNKSSKNKKNSLPNGVFDIYVMDTNLFYKINGWAKGIFKNY